MRDYDYRTDSNRLDTMKHQWGSSGTGTVETRLTYNVVGARATEKTQGPDWLATLGRTGVPGVQTDYSYSARLEVASSGKYPLAAAWSLLEGENTSVLTATARDYTYDEIGNRTTDQDGSYTPNELNQYSATPGIASLSYDANGNLTGDGTRTYDYDAENRLTRVTEPGVRKSEYVYDYLGRRITKSVYTWNAGSQLWALNAQLKFLYDGWNLIAELSGSGTVIRTFVWGLDVSGTWQGAGGVGGLLIADAGGSPRYPIYDASHNVIGLYDGNGATVAAYEYDPFGNLQTTSLTADATSNPFRSATKYTDSETGLIYYGLRYYSPRLGRFIHRDPIEEQGGVNLYAFCGNDGVNRYDMLGMNFWDTIKSMLGIGQGSYQPSSPTREPSADEEAREKAERAAERAANREAIGKFGVTGWLSHGGRGDADVQQAGRTAYDQSMAASDAMRHTQPKGGQDYYITDIPGIERDSHGPNSGDARSKGGITGTSAAGTSTVSPQDVTALTALKAANPLSIKDNLEYAGLVYQKKDGSYAYTGPLKGTDQGANPYGAPAPAGTTVVGDYHTHGDYSVVDPATGRAIRTSDPNRDSFNSDNFSGPDISGITNDAHGNPAYRGYLGTPSGVFKVYDPVTKTFYTIP